jgi:hypothetical protein
MLRRKNPFVVLHELPIAKEKNSINTFNINRFLLRKA